MLQKTKKVVLVGAMTVMTLGLIGCGKNSDVQKTSDISSGINNVKDVVSDVHSAQKIDRNDIKAVQKRLGEIKKETLKIQMDKTLSKEQKAAKIQALQKEMREFTNKAMGK